MIIKCLIVDDEPLAVQLLEHHARQTPFLSVAATAPNALKAFELLATHSFDLMFLDVKMPHLTGIDFLKSLKNPPKTIITTAYRDFAVEGYELEATDYLLKPITFERFLKAVERAVRRPETSLPQVTSDTEKRFMIFKSGPKHYKVYLDDILYVESLKDYVRVFLANGKSIVSKHKIGDLEAAFGVSQLMRIHRSFIVNAARITAFTATDVEIGGVEIPIGALYKPQFER